MDTETGLTILGGAFGSVKVVEKLLGPTADYLGNGIKNFAEKGIKNISDIFSRATIMLGDAIDKSGTIPPVVLKEIIINGAYCEEELTKAYYAGVLASSRTEDGKDDRGKAMASVIGRLSTYQIRAHFILYKLFKEVYDGKIKNCGLSDTMSRMGINMPDFVFNIAMNFNNTELNKSTAIVSHALNGLYRERLINESWSMHSIDINKYDFCVRPETCGYELFLFVHGYSDKSVSCFLNTELKFTYAEDIHIPEGYLANTDEPRAKP